MSNDRHDTLHAPAQSGAGQRSVLVVDDDEAFARAVQRTLEKAGFEVFVADNGTTAVETIMSRPFDVIVTDINMPKMSGLELLGIVRAYDLDVPVILLTGEPTVETATEAVSLGALQYLSKPTPNDVLVKAVERASRLHRMAEMKRDALRLSGAEDASAGDRAGLQTRFDSALASMWIAFQPIVDAKRRRIFGYEALMRTREPSLPHPGAVLGAAERLDRLTDLGRRVRKLASEAFERAPSTALLFVNLHTRDLLDTELYEPSSPLTRFASRVVLKPEIVKLDMSLVRNVHQSDVRQRLIGSMTSLCKEMGMQVVAEGVEVAEERACVLGIGCDLLQGYLFAKPGPPFPTVDGMT